MGNLLSHIQSPADLRGLTVEQLQQVCTELREAIVSNLSTTGGHFASNLGAVELIVALHTVYDTPRDRIIFDVGHQCYAHKMLTGRLQDFPTLRQLGGISGFLRREESTYDAFGAGHASTSISAAFGFAVARDLRGTDERVVAVIGDAGLTGGLAFEGLNNAGHSGRDFTVVLNDNGFSIAPNVGALARYLSRLRASGWYQHLEKRTQEMLKKLPAGEVAARAAGGLKQSITHLVTPTQPAVAPELPPGQVPGPGQTGVMFEEMGFQYIGPLDGHDLPLLLEVFRQVRRMKGPVLVHLLTQKGRGYPPAEENARKYHAVTPFEPATGLALKASQGCTYTSVFADTMVELAREDPQIVGITAAMPDGTGLSKLQKDFPDRVFDVGIAEGHAVCFAAGLAAAGMKPVVAIYSTFLQRAYDMIIHDVAIQRLPVIFALDRAGLVGEDGCTHHGIFDLSYLRTVPGMVVMAPATGAELAAMLRFAVAHVSGKNASPIAIRYPRGEAVLADPYLSRAPIELGHGHLLKEGSDVAFIALGSMVAPALEASRLLESSGVQAAVFNARFAKPLDEEMILSLARRTERIVVCEENSVIGGFGDGVIELLVREGLDGVMVRHFGVPDRFIEHGAQAVLRQLCHLTAEDFARAALDLMPARRTAETAGVRALSLHRDG